MGCTVTPSDMRRLAETRHEKDQARLAAEQQQHDTLRALQLAEMWRTVNDALARPDAAGRVSITFHTAYPLSTVGGADVTAIAAELRQEGYVVEPRKLGQGSFTLLVSLPPLPASEGSA